MPKRPTKKNRLYRSTSDVMLAGVAGGLAERFNLDATLLRILFALLTIFGGSGLFIYLALWIIMPSEASLGTSASKMVKKNVGEIEGVISRFFSGIKNAFKNTKPRTVWGALLFALGIIWLLNNFGVEYVKFERLWPLIIVFVGLKLLLR